MNAIDESNIKILSKLEIVEFIDTSRLGTVVSVMKHLGKSRKMDLLHLPQQLKRLFA